MLNSYQQEIESLLMKIADFEQLVSSLMDEKRDLEYSLEMANERKELEP